MPTAEINLCGHAKLAAAYLMFKSSLAPGARVVSHTRSAAVRVENVGGEAGGWEGHVELSFPIVDASLAGIDAASLLPQTLRRSTVALSAQRSAWTGSFWSSSSAADVKALAPRFHEIAQCGMAGEVIITTPGAAASRFGFVSRFFAPLLGMIEDAVCGTANCALAPFPPAKVGKELLAYQASKRDGVLKLYVDEDARRILLRGNAVIVSVGVLLC